MTTQVLDDTQQSRYTISVDGELAGIAGYRDIDGTRVFTHTEVLPAFKGRGLATTLIEAALHEVRALDKRIVALCPFVHSYIESHPEAADLVDEDLDARLRR